LGEFCWEGLCRSKEPALGRILFLVFMIVPLIEIAFFVVIGNAIGLWPTLAGVLVTAIIGSLVLRWQGAALFQEIRGTMARGQLPARALADAAFVGAGGLMLLLPGYFSDLVGILVLIPPVRNVIYEFLKSRIKIVPNVAAGYSRPAPPPEGTIDLDETDWRRR
jgi:UPF0716 protein FxsA